MPETYKQNIKQTFKDVFELIIRLQAPNIDFNKGTPKPSFFANKSIPTKPQPIEKTEEDIKQHKQEPPPPSEEEKKDEEKKTEEEEETEERPAKETEKKEEKEEKEED